MNNREKVIEKYVVYFLKTFKDVEKMGVNVVNYNGLKIMIENLLEDIHIADSPQGPEDIKPIKEEKIDEMGKFEVLSLEREIDVKMVDKINELVRRVNKGI